MCVTYEHGADNYCTTNNWLIFHRVLFTVYCIRGHRRQHRPALLGLGVSCNTQLLLPSKTGPCPPSRDLCTLGVITISPFTSRLFPGALPPLLPLHCHNNTVNYIGSQVDPQWPFPLKTRSIIHRLLLGAEWHGPIYQRLLFNMG